MNVLKKAEFAHPIAQRESSLTAKRSPSPESPRPRLPQRMADLDERFLSAASTTTNRAQATTKRIPFNTQNVSLTSALGWLALLALIGITSHLWWQLQPPSVLLTTAPENPLPATAVIPTPTLTESAQPGHEKMIATVTAPRTPSTGRPAEPSAQALMPPVLQPPEQLSSPIKLSRSQRRIHPLLTKGYEQFVQGHLADARLSYEQVLTTDPHSVDALHGMAALALGDHRPDVAEHYFQRVLRADPHDPDAIAGLANLRGHINPGATETRLRGMIATHPELAAPQFALGNLLSSQERWSEAQQAYFKAYSSDPDNPDILFNLAVSLEHLRQSRLAAQYYSLAVDAAAKRPAGFDTAQASARLRALQP